MEGDPELLALDTDDLGLPFLPSATYPENYEPENLTHPLNGLQRLGPPRKASQQLNHVIRRDNSHLRGGNGREPSQAARGFSRLQNKLTEFSRVQQTMIQRLDNIERVQQQFSLEWQRTIEKRLHVVEQYVSESSAEFERFKQDMDEKYNRILRLAQESISRVKEIQQNFEMLGAEDDELV